MSSIFFEILTYYESTFAKSAGFDYKSLPEKMEIVDPIYGKIIIKRPVLYLTSLPIVERLSRIRQLAMTNLVYIGANHTRLEHSLGTSYLMENIPNDVDENDRLILSIAGLLHDLGHSGWGHALDGLTGFIATKLIEVGKITGRQYPVYNPSKLDALITNFLLYENYQLINALKIIVSELKNGNWLGIDIKNHQMFRDLLTWIISEEEEGYDAFCKSQEWSLLTEKSRKQIMNRVKYFQELLGRKINCDRLDWVIRDAHHAFQSAEKFSESDFANFKESLKNLKISWNDVVQSSRKDLEKLLKIRDSTREKLYSKVYEGLERSFIDSLITRLAYSSCILLMEIGKSVASLTTVINAIMGYLFSPDEQLVYFTEKLLKAWYFRQIEVPELNKDLSQFLTNSYTLFEILFRNLKSVLAIITEQPRRPSSEIPYMYYAGNLAINSYKIGIYYLDGRWVNANLLNKNSLALDAAFEKIIENTSGNNEAMRRIFPKIIWSSIYNFFGEVRADIFSVFRIVRLENEINSNSEISEEHKVYPLINFYFFNRLFRHINKISQKIKIGNDIEEIFRCIEKLLTEGYRIDNETLGPYREMPLLFLLVEGENPEPNVLKKLESLTSMHMRDIVQRSIGTLISSAYATFRKKNA